MPLGTSAQRAFARASRRRPTHFSCRFAELSAQVCSYGCKGHVSRDNIQLPSGIYLPS